MILKIVLDDGAFIPGRAHRYDAGLDLRSMEAGILMPGSGKAFSTGVHAQIPEGYCGLIRSRSGMMFKHDIVTDGTVDAHYTGAIRVKLFNLGAEPYEVRAGDRIAQMVIVPCELPGTVVEYSLGDTDRGDGGFGSTGR